MAAISNLAARALTAVILAPAIIFLIYWQNPIGFALLVFAAVAVGLNEFYGMTLEKDDRAARLVGVVGGLAFSVVFYLSPTGIWPLAALAAVTLATFLFYLLRFGEMTTVGVRIALNLAGVLYVALLLTPIALLKKLPGGPGWVLMLLCITWMGDTGAYFAGRFLGKRKLYPAVSPAKTIAGALGGLAASLGATLLAKFLFLRGLTYVDCVLLALPAGALGQAGNLCESLLKRASGVKDSGKLLPGHGGMLDRIDAVLFATPYVYFYAAYATSRAGWSS